MRRARRRSPQLQRNIRLTRMHPSSPGDRAGAARATAWQHRRNDATGESFGRVRLQAGLFQAANDPMLVVDLQGRYLEANEAACRHLGYTREELSRTSVHQINGLTEEGWQQTIARIMQFGSRIAEIEHHRKDGTVVPVEVSVRAITYEGRTAFLSIVRNVGQRKAIEAELVRRNHELAWLVAENSRLEQLAASEQSPAAASSQTTPDEIFAAIVEQASRVVSFDGIVLALHNAPTRQFVIRQRAGQDAVLPAFAETWPHDPLLDDILLRQEIAFSPDGASAWAAGGRSDDARAMAVPLVSKGSVQGALILGRCAGGAGFAPSDGDVCIPVATQLATAIENGRLLEEIRALAIREERSRLGREMHDRIGQALASAGAYSAAAAEMLRGGHVGEANWAVGEVSKALQQAVTDLRDAIHALRSPGDTYVEWAEGLRQYIARFDRECGIRCDFSLEAGVASGCDALSRLELMRIVQEALNNVRKHAHAEHASVAIRVTGDSVLAEIADDGRGFDLAAPAPGHFGLQTMHERAHGLGGELFIESGPSGTRICARVPRRDISRGRV